MAIGISTAIGFNKRKSWSSYWTKRSLFWQDALDFVNNKITDKSGHPLNAPSLVKSNCYASDGTLHGGVMPRLISDYIATENTEIEMYARYTDLTASNYNGNFGSPNSFAFGNLTNTKYRVVFANKTLDTTELPDLLWHTFKLNKVGFYVDGVIKKDVAGSGYAWGTPAQPLWFADCNGISAGNKIEIAWIKIRENGTLLREFILNQGIGYTVIYDSLGSGKYLSLSGAAGSSDAGHSFVTQNTYHFNLQRGFDVWQNDTNGSYIYFTLKSDGTSIKGNGDTIVGFTWIAKYTQDGKQFLPCETKLNFPVRAELTALDNANLWFNAAKDAVNDVGYFDIAQVDFNYFNFRTHKDLIIANKASKISYFL